MKYHLITYGCQMNTADSEEMSQPLESRGLRRTANIDEADVVLMNTCTVRDQAEHRAKSNLGRLADWKTANPDRILIVAGCAASRWGDSIRKRFPFIDAVSPATQIEQFPEFIEKVLQARWSVSEFRGNGVSELPPDTSIPPYPDTLFGSTATAYVTIMRGCNYSCSYCIVPQVRGRESYRPMNQILAEIQAQTARGYKEVMLLGQTVNSYYWKPHPAFSHPLPQGEGSGVRQVLDFADLLRAVNALDGVEAIRFMSPHPKHMRDRVIEAMAESPKVCRHIHLPAQSGSDRILSEMKRLYTRDEYLAIVRKLRAAMPGILITTDVIVGYPGETENNLEDTLSLMRDVRFDGLFAFKFSPRPGTSAAEQPDNVPDTVKEERLQRVLALNRELVGVEKIFP